MTSPADASLRDPRAAELLRGLLDAAGLAHAQQGAADTLQVVRARLEALGLSLLVFERDGERGRFRAEQSSAGPLSVNFSERWPGWAPAAEFPQRLTGLDGVWLADFAGRPAVAAEVPVGGHPALAIFAQGDGLSPLLASAFGLFGRQLGASIEASLRLAELATTNRELSTVNQVARASATLGSSAAQEEALDSLISGADLQAAALFRVVEGGRLVLAAQRGFPAGFTDKPAAGAAGEQPWELAARTGEGAFFAARALPRIDRIFARSEVHPEPSRSRSALGDGQPAHGAPGAIPHGVALPLQSGGAALGVLLAVRDPSRPLLPADVHLLDTVGSQLSISLQNVALYQSAQRQADDLSQLFRFGQTVMGMLELQPALKAGVQAAAQLLRAECAMVLVPVEDVEGPALRCIAAESPPDVSLLGTTLPLSSRSLSVAAYQTRKPQSSVDAADDPRVASEFSARYQSRSCLSLPLLARGKCLGVLTLFERTNQRVYQPDDLRVASLLAQQLSMAFENARLFAAQRERAEELGQLNELGRSLTGALDLQALLDGVCERIRALYSASHCFVMLLEEDGKQLRFAGFLERDRAFCEGRVLRMDEPSLAAVAIRSRRAIQERDAGRSPYTNRALVDQFGERSVLAVPLVARDEVVGAIVIDDSGRERVFESQEVERLTSIARQVGLAVISARLYGDLRKSYAELARTQAELIDRERLAALGELSASIAHEVRNPLGVIFNSLGSLKRLIKAEGDVGLLLNIIGEEADRLNRMVGDLLDYSRPMQPTLQALPLAPLVEDALTAAKTQAREQDAGALDVRIGVLIPASLVVRADPRLLRQALVNLFVNALQAMHRGGELAIQGGIEPGAPPMARLSILDSGPGVPAEMRARIFQPFFTTKATGTGLGLAVVRRILQGHGGRIELGEPARGAEFLLFLPLAASE